MSCLEGSLRGLERRLKGNCNDALGTLGVNKRNRTLDYPSPSCLQFALDLVNDFDKHFKGIFTCFENLSKAFCEGLFKHILNAFKRPYKAL